MLYEIGRSGLCSKQCRIIWDASVPLAWAPLVEQFHVHVWLNAISKCNILTAVWTSCIRTDMTHTTHRRRLYWDKDTAVLHVQARVTWLLLLLSYTLHYVTVCATEVVVNNCVAKTAPWQTMGFIKLCDDSNFFAEDIKERFPKIFWLNCMKYEAARFLTIMNKLHQYSECDEESNDAEA